MGSKSNCENMLTVQVVEDDEYIREILVKTLEEHPQLQITAHSATFAEACKALGDPPDVLIVDLGLPDGDGTDLIRISNKTTGGKTKSIVFSMFGDEVRVVQAIEAGASGYLLKDTEVSVLASSILDLAEGKSPISPAIATYLLKRFQPSTERTCSKQESSKLSVRELQVLRCVAKGFSGKETAKLLDISYHTFISHTRKIYQKLNVSSRAEAVFEAEQAGIISLRD